MSWRASLVGVVCAAACVSAPSSFASTCPLKVDGWSPNGEYIAVTRLYYPSTRSDVGIVNADGRSLRLVSHSSASDGGGVNPVWAPDSRSLVYLRAAAPGTRAYRHNWTTVLRYDLHSGRTRVLGVGTGPSYGPHGLTYVAPRGIIVDGKLLVRGAFIAAAWSPSGTRLGLLRRMTTLGTAQLVITDASGQHPRVISRHVLASARGYAWSPDGRKLAYLGSSRLFIANADGSNAHNPVHTVPDEVTDFAWAPNSQRIALIGPGYVATVAADGTGLTVIPGVVAGQDHGVYWSPDSTRIAVAPVIVSLATGDVVRLPVALDITLIWSPDGSMLVDGNAFVAGGLYLISGDGSTYTHVGSCGP